MKTIVSWVVAGIASAMIGTVAAPSPPPSPPPAAASAVPPLTASPSDGIRAVHMVFKMAIRRGEDFPYVNLGGSLQRVEVWLQEPLRPDDPGRMRFDKPDRIYAFDGKTTVLYFVPKEAERITGPYNIVYLFWPPPFLDILEGKAPEGIEVLERDAREGEGRLLYRAKGTLSNPMGPSFWGDFDRETEMVWDLATRRLKGLRRWVQDGNKRRLYMELESIEYLPSIDEKVFQLDLPASVRWQGLRPGPPEFEKLAPREAATRFFEAWRDGDRATLELYCDSPGMVDKLLDQRVSEIFYIGEPVPTASADTVLVPYKVRIGKGLFSHVKTWRLALRRDETHKRWVWNGGI